MQPMEKQERLLKPREVAEMLGISLKRLEAWRYERRGLPFIKLSKRAVRYKLSDVTKLLEVNRTEIIREAAE